MTFDPHRNLAYSTVATPPSPSTSGTSLAVQSGDGILFPAPGTDGPFNVTIWPAGAIPTKANAEIARVTARSTDTFTITRAQEGTSSRAIVAGDQIAATITAKSFTDIEAAVGGGSSVGNGEESLYTVAASGSALTVDFGNGATQDITLTAGCTLSLTGAVSGKVCSLTLVLRQDATGGRTVTWPGAVTWLSGAVPTLHTAAAALDVIHLFTVDGGTTWLGAQVNPTAVGSWTTYDCAPTGFSGTPTQRTSRYTVFGNVCVVYLDVTGTSNSTGFTLQLPFNAQRSFWVSACEIVNNGSSPASGGPPGLASVGAAPTKTLTIYRDAGGTGWTASGTKAVQGTVIYEI